MAYWRDWKFIQDLTQGTLDTLIYDPQRDMLTFPEGIRICWGPSRLGSKGVHDRVWWSYSDPETGDIWVAKSDKNFMYWEERQRLLFVPSGSTNPSVVFDNDGRYVVAVEFLPAGSEQKEIWLYEPPYSGVGIRQITFGQYPILTKGGDGEIYLFYQSPDLLQLLYRKKSDDFTAVYIFEESEVPLMPSGFRVPTTILTDYHQRYHHIMFYQEGEEGLLKYKMSTPTDLYTVGLDLFVTDLQGRGISGVHVEIGGQFAVTAGDGLVTFFNLPFDASVEIKLSHPFLGLGDTQHIFIPESAKGNHVSWALVFEIPKLQEYVEPYARVVALTWQGTEYIEHLAEDELYLDANLGIEWEEVRSPEHHVQDSLELKATVDSEWVRIYRLHTYPDEELELSAEIKSILWVEV